MPFSLRRPRPLTAPPVIVIASPIGGSDGLDVMEAAAQWFWDQGLRGDPRKSYWAERGDPESANKALCVLNVRSLVQPDAMAEVLQGPRVAVVVQDNIWDLRRPSPSMGDFMHVSHACVCRSTWYRRVSDKDFVGVPPDVRLVPEEDIGPKAGMTLFKSTPYARALGFPGSAEELAEWEAAFADG